MSRPIDPRLPRAAPAVRHQLAVLAALQVAGALLILAQAGLLADLIVAIFLGGAHGTALLARLGLLAAVGAGRAAIAAAQEWVCARASVRARATLRRAVLDALVRLGPGWVAQQPAGRLVTAAGPGLEGLDGYLTRALPALVAAGVIPGLVLLRIGIADWQSAVVLIIALPLVPLFMALIGIVTRRHMDRQYAALARMAGHFLDLVQGLTTLKVYGHAKRQVETVRRSTDAYRKRTLTTLRVAFTSGLAMDLIATLSVAVVAVDVGLRLDRGGLGLRTALVVLLLAPELFAPLRAIGAQHHASEEGRAAASAALDIVDEAAQLPPAPKRLRRAIRANGTMAIEQLRVSYPDRDSPALDGLGVVFRRGEIVAVQGESGAGKSTLLATLLRFVPYHGAITVGTLSGFTDLGRIDPVAWRANIAWVPQRPQPTQPTVGEEVALGDPAATDDEVADAIACCHAPHSHTPLGEDGTQISAGQRRRVALARALLRARRVQAGGGVPIVLLDEPSEDLDAATEQVVVAVVSELAGWATVVMATHSERLAATADRRIVLARGRLDRDVEQQPRRAAGMAAASTPLPVSSAQPDAEPLSSPLGGLLNVRQASRRLIGAALLGGGSGLSALALTATSIWLICRAAQHPNVQELAIAVVGVRTFALGRALLRYAERLVSHDSALRMLADLRSGVFAALEPLAPMGLSGFRRGDLLRRFVADVDGVQEGLVRAVVPTAGAIVTAAGAVALAGLLAPTAGLVLAAALLGAGLVPWLVRRISGPGADLARAAGRRDTRLTAALDGLGELTAYGAERRAIAGIARADLAVARASHRPAMAASIGTGLGGSVAAITLPAVLAAGAAAAESGQLSAVSVGVLAACVLAGFDVIAPLPAAYAAWSRLRAGLNRVAEVLGARPPVAEPDVPADVPVRRPGLLVATVTLAPAPGMPAVLRSADLAMRPGERVAVLGPSGCGKSTLLAAALRLLNADKGTIALTTSEESTPLNAMRSSDLPPLVAGSLQGDHVFNTSLRDNLRVVRPYASDADLDEVAERAGLADFVRALPSGWSAPAGPDGAALSGGQRQRLLLARALLADPQILVLDEPTAHLDPATEQAVLADLLTGTRGRTVLLSTHRRIAPEQFDQVVCLDSGSLVAEPLGQSTLTASR